MFINRDPNHYPSSDRFKSERFIREEHWNKQRSTLLTFGEGPRVCLEMKFIMAQANTYRIKFPN